MSISRLVQVSNLSTHCTKEQLSTLFSYIGPLEESVLYPEGETLTATVGTKVGYVRFSRTESARIAIHLTNIIFIEKQLIVAFVLDGRIPDEADAIKYCAPLNPNITLIAGGPTWNSTIINRVVGQGVNAQIETVDPELADRGLPPYPNLPGSLDHCKAEEIRRTVYISNIDRSVTLEMLEEFISQIGEVRFIRAAYDKENDETHDAYVEFTEQNSVSKALCLNGFHLISRPIEVNHALMGTSKSSALTMPADLSEGSHGRTRSRSRKHSSLRSRSRSPRRSSRSRQKHRSSSSERRDHRSSSRRYYRYRRSPSYHRPPRYYPPIPPPSGPYDPYYRRPYYGPPYRSSGRSPSPRYRHSRRRTPSCDRRSRSRHRSKSNRPRDRRSPENGRKRSRSRRPSKSHDRRSKSSRKKRSSRSVEKHSDEKKSSRRRSSSTDRRKPEKKEDKGEKSRSSKRKSSDRHVNEPKESAKSKPAKNESPSELWVAAEELNSTKSSKESPRRKSKNESTEEESSRNSSERNCKKKRRKKRSRSRRKQRRHKDISPSSTSTGRSSRD